jgi:hypothetical protein
MDRNSTPPQTTAPVEVTVLSHPEARFVARVTDCSATRLELTTGSPVARGATVKVEWGETLLLGEVRHCHARDEGFAVGVSVEHALYHTQELARLARRLLEEDTRRVDTSRGK